MPVVLRHTLNEEQSKSYIVRSVVDVNTWLRSPPSVDVARPKQCRGCGAAARPIGESLVLHGHGVRERQVREPAAFGDASVVVAIEARRYKCQLCNAVMTVVPRSVLPGLLYTAQAIGWALALYGMDGARMSEVRRVVAAGRHVGHDATGWPSLRRWITRASTLWPSVRESPSEFDQRQRAERIAVTLAAHAPSLKPLSFAAFVGAALAP